MTAAKRTDQVAAPGGREAAELELARQLALWGARSLRAL